MAVRWGLGVVILVLTYGSFTRAECPESWTSAGFQCYKAFAEPKTWKEAEAHCQSHSQNESKAHLASVSDIPENALLKGWLEVTKSNVTDPWLGLQPVATFDDALGDTWTDGNPADLPVWIEEGILDEEFMFMTEMCLTLSTKEGSWLPTECTKHRPYVCKLSICPRGWIAYGGRCYHTFQAKKSWVHAEKHCKSFSKDVEFHLASIADAMENRFLLTTTPDNPPPVWIGMKGMTEDGKSTVWSEDEGFDLSAVDTKGSAKNKNNTCVAMNVEDDVVWQDAACKDLLPYFCKLSMCRRGWTAFQGSCLWYNLKSHKKVYKPNTESKGKKRVRRGIRFGGLNFKVGGFNTAQTVQQTRTTSTFGTTRTSSQQLASQPTFNSQNPSLYSSAATTGSTNTRTDAVPNFSDLPELLPWADVDVQKGAPDMMRCLGGWTPHGAGKCKRFWPAAKRFVEARDHCASFTYTGDNGMATAYILPNIEEESEEELNKYKSYTCEMDKVFKEILI